jgi:hypothetical protein
MRRHLHRDVRRAAVTECGQTAVRFDRVRRGHRVAAFERVDAVTERAGIRGAPSEAGRFFTEAKRDIGLLLYSGMFLAEDAGMVKLLGDKAAAGVRVRILLGDPDSPQVAQRGADEGIGAAMGAKARNALVLYQPIRDIDGVEIRQHGTILYNSIYRADDQFLINPHVYGQPAANAPVLHLKKVIGGDMVATYAASFERVWEQASPVES